jgi:preprotein translocase subunit SecE
MGDSKKILTVSFVLASILVAFVTGILLDLVGGMYGPAARLLSKDTVRHGFPVALGLATFLVFQLNPRIKSWADDVVIELKKVVFPSRKETVAMTVVVCIMLVISGIFLGLFDIVSSFVLNAFLKT